MSGVYHVPDPVQLARDCGVKGNAQLARWWAQAARRSEDAYLRAAEYGWRERHSADVAEGLPTLRFLAFETQTAWVVSALYALTWTAEPQPVPSAPRCA